jgi:hypothetical protein
VVTAAHTQISFFGYKIFYYIKLFFELMLHGMILTAIRIATACQAKSALAQYVRKTLHYPWIPSHFLP